MNQSPENLIHLGAGLKKRLVMARFDAEDQASMSRLIEVARLQEARTKPFAAESAWTICIEFNGRPHYLTTSNGRMSWSSDLTIALRLAREQDAVSLRSAIHQFPQEAMTCIERTWIEL